MTIKKCVEVGSKEYLGEGIPFVRVSNLSPFEITEEKYISEALYADIKKRSIAMWVDRSFFIGDQIKCKEL